LRIALLFNHEELLGKTRAFDGMVLFLPKKLPDQVGLCSSPVGICVPEVPVKQNILL
jgi:hypothetical protein